MDLKTEEGYHYYVALLQNREVKSMNSLSLQNKSLLQWIITRITRITDKLWIDLYPQVSDLQNQKLATPTCRRNRINEVGDGDPQRGATAAWGVATSRAMHNNPCCEIKKPTNASV